MVPDERTGSSSRVMRAGPAGRAFAWSTRRRGRWISTTVVSLARVNGPDPVVKRGPGGRPPGVDIADVAGADDPARLVIGVGQDSEHRLR